MITTICVIALVYIVFRLTLAYVGYVVLQQASHASSITTRTERNNYYTLDHGSMNNVINGRIE